MATALTSIMFLLSLLMVFVGVVCIDKGFDYLGQDLSRVLIIVTGTAILGTGCWMMVVWLTP
jgi:hypothetical protein